MTYTPAMARAFHSIRPPNNFSVEIMDEDHFISIVARERVFFSLPASERVYAVEYMLRVKQALEDNGAVVLITREGGQEP